MGVLGFHISRVAPRAGLGTAGAERSEVPRFPTDSPVCQDSQREFWLAALDDFRNWLIRAP